MNDVLEKLRLYLLRDKGLQPTTVDLNLKLARRLCKECDPLNEKTASDFITGLIDKRRDADYINQYIVVLHYIGDVTNNSSLKDYPFYKPKRRDEYIRAVLSDEEVEAFLTLPNTYPQKGVYWQRFEMWRVFWYICAYHGFRMGEVVKHKRYDVDFGRNVIIVSGKTGNRIVPLSFVAKPIALNFIENIMQGEYLFPPLRKTKLPYMKDQSWQEDFEKRINRLAEKYPDMAHRKNLEPYSLRHSFGTRMADENVSLFKIQKAMGHKKLDTTAKYIHMSLKSVAEMIENDRLAMPHKKGVDIIQSFIDFFHEADKRYSKKVFINVMKKDKEGKKITIDIEALD